MARAVHVRLDTESEAALTVLRAEGMNDSQAVRRALAEAREHRRRRASLREEARRLAGDPADRAELAALRDELEELAPQWPAE
jgi:Arc/MetJ-type ribon-helix-helix transcriptional regulator